MKIRFVLISLSVAWLLGMVCCGQTVNAAGASDNKVEVTAIDINREDKEVGLERLKLMDKVLSQDMLDRKLSMVRQIEAEYNQKALELVNSIIPPVFKNKVVTHIDVNFFATEFDAQVKASQNISVSVILRQAGFDRWQQRYETSPEALSAMKKIISDTLRIPDANVSLTLTD